jgi:RHS repeat-associated protein
MVRRAARRLRRLATAALAPVLGAAQFAVPVAIVAAAGTVLASVAHPAPARAASQSVLILSTSVNGGSSSAEAADVPAGDSVTVAPPSTWDSMTTAQFAAYSAIVIGDPSTSSSCALTPPSDAVSTAATWGGAVTGNVAVVGTAPVFAGSAGTSLIKDGIAYALAGSGTGLYVSLNCEYQNSPAGTAVPLLSGVDGGGFTATGQGAGCPNSGTVNTWEAGDTAQFTGISNSALGGWAGPACSVMETLDSWPAGFNALAYYQEASPANFTASDGATGQPYVLLGARVTAATAALAPTTGGEVLAGTTTGGSNPAAPGVTQASAGDPVNTEDGDFTQSSTDAAIPAYGPALDFTRTYDAQTAQQQTQLGKPGPLGYGWTDNWDTSLSVGNPAPGYIYTIAGLATNTGEGGPPTSAAMNTPDDVMVSGADTYIADYGDNRVEEIPGTSKTQWGQSMTAGDIYTIAGSDTGRSGASANGTAAGSSLLNLPEGLAMDSAGDLFIADTGNARVVEIPASSGTHFAISMTAGDLYTIAGRAGQPGLGTDGKAATSSDLSGPSKVSVGPGSKQDVYIADTNNNRIQEVSATAQSEWGQSMTAGYVYTVAGSAAGTGGASSNGTAAGSTLLQSPKGVALDSSGDLYVADTDNCRIEEIAAAAGTQWGTAMTKYGLYTVAGRDGSNCTIGVDNKAATTSNLNFPDSVNATGGNLYIADTYNNRIQEVAQTAHTQFGQSMTADDVYTVAGRSNGAAGDAGDGGPDTSAYMQQPDGATLTASGDLLAADSQNSEVRDVNAASAVISAYAGGVGTLGDDGDGGPALGSGLSGPGDITSDQHGDLFVADTARVQEIAVYSHKQFGISMTAGSTYTVAGQRDGVTGSAGDGGNATSGYLNAPEGVAVDAAGDLYIADTANNRVQEVSAATGNMSTIAGSATGASGDSGDGGAASAALLNGPMAVAVDAAGNVYIADTFNSRIQEVAAASQSQWGQQMTAGDIYTVAGSVTGAAGSSGDGGPATSALLYEPRGMSIDSAGNLYIADFYNNRVQEVAAAGHLQWGTQMTAGDVYTVAGSASGKPGNSGDGGAATAATLDTPYRVAVDSSGNLYIMDSGNNRVREVAAANGTAWGQSMTAGDIYDVAGVITGSGSSAGVPATTAPLDMPEGVGVDPSGDVFVTNFASGTVQEVTATPTPTFPLYPSPTAVTVTEPGGAQTVFSAKPAGGCASPDVLAGSYCTLPQNVGATLAYSSSANAYTFSPAPGTTYEYGSNGALESESDAAGATLSVNPGTPAPGSGGCPAAAAACETITAASGRSLVIGSNSNGLVTSLTDPLGRAWTYAYNSASDLVSATDPMGGVTSYTYGPGSQGGPLQANDLLTITNPNAQPGGPEAGDSTVNVYDALGRVTAQTDPVGLKTTFNYCVNAAAGDCLDAATGNGFVSVTDPDSNSTVFDYEQGTLAAEADWTGATGNSLAAERDSTPDTTAASSSNPSGGTLLDATSTDGDGNTTSYSYNASGNVTAATSPGAAGGPATTTSAYTSALQDVSCDGAAAAASTANCSEDTGPAAVAPGGVITPPSAAPPLGLTYALYDTDGNELYQTTAVYQPGASAASYLQTTYSLFRGNSVTLGSTNITCTTTPPAQSLPCATINADGVVTQLAYNSAGDLTSSATPDGNGSEIATTTYAYDGDGEQTATTSPDGNLSGANAGNYTTTIAYNADGAETSVTKAGGSGATVTPRATTYGYDGDGNQTTVQDARGYTTTTVFNADDKPALVTNPDGDATLTCYDGNGYVAQTVPPAGVAGNSLTAASCPSAYPAGYTDRLAADATTYTYDAAGQRTAVTIPAPAGQSSPQTTAYAYDGDGNLVKTTAPPVSNGGQPGVTTDTYGSADQLASVTTAAGTSAASTVSYCYDPNGDQTSVVSADGNVSAVANCETASPWIVSASSYPAQAGYQTTSAYDSAGELVSTTAPATAAAPSGATTTSTYDPAGNMLTRTDPNGVKTTWTYTPLDLTASVSYSGSSAHSVSNTYDADGNKTGMSDASGSSSDVYDPFGELTSATNGANQVTGYGYDADGDTTSISYPLPAAATWATTSTVNYGYDHADQLTTITDFNGHQITIGNTADGLPNSAALGATGDTISTSYDNTDTASAIALKNSSSTLQSFTYADAPDGNVLSETDTPSSAQSPAVYTYDAAGRVTSMTPGTGATLHYGFDASTDLTTLPTGAAGTYDKAGELTSSALSGTTASYTYNADGEQLTATQGSTAVSAGTWNGAGQLATYNDGTANLTAATYDGNGVRASSTITPSGKSAVSQGYVWDTTAPIPQLIMDSVNAYIYGDGNSPAEQVNLSTGTTTYLVADRLGSVRGTVNSAGALTGTANYDAWGNPETAGGLTATTPFGYAGGYTDPTGLLYLLNRYYNPAIGQFVSVDPAITQTLQPYAYADGDPVSLADPTGLGWWEYQTYKFDSRISEDIDYDYSVQMNGDMVKAAAKVGKRLTKVSVYINALIAVIGTVVHNHHEVIQIAAAVSAILAVAGMNLKKWVTTVRGWWKGKGRHVGFYARTFEDLFGQSFEATYARHCESNSASCGSPGKRIKGGH